MSIQVNVTTKVNNKAIRKETYNNREHWILSSYTLPANVIMNGGLYTSEQIDRHYEGIEGTLAPLGHPVMDGQFISARSAEGINQGHVGAWNRNVKKSGNRVHVEKWIDIDVANQSDKGRELIERIEAIEHGDDVLPIHTSIAVFLEQLEPNEQQKAMGAEWVADIKSVDHDAILLHEVGAATPEQGVGMMVNSDSAQPVSANKGQLVGESFRDLEQKLQRAANDKFANDDNEYTWIADFTDSQAVVIENGGDAKIYDYTQESGKIVYSDVGTPVMREESWVKVVANKVKSIFKPQEKLAANHKEGDMPLTKEEKDELFSEIGKGIAANVSEALKPITEKVDTLQANQEKQFEALTANSRKEEADKREVIAKTYGEVVANSLQGEALDEMFKKCGTASPLGTNSANTPAQTGAPSADEYFKS